MDETEVEEEEVQRMLALCCSLQIRTESKESVKSQVRSPSSVAGSRYLDVIHLSVWTITDILAPDLPPLHASSLDHPPSSTVDERRLLLVCRPWMDDLRVMICFYFFILISCSPLVCYIQRNTVQEREREVPSIQEAAATSQESIDRQCLCTCSLAAWTEKKTIIGCIFQYE